MTSQKCPYQVTFELDLDLEHNLDAGPSGDHRVQVWWRSSHVYGRRSDFRVGRSVRITWPLVLTLTLSTPWMQVHKGTIVCKFGSDPATSVVEVAICAKFTDRYRQTDRQTDRQTTDASRLHKLMEWAKNYDSILYTTRVMANFLLKFPNFRYHGKHKLSLSN